MTAYYNEIDHYAAQWLRNLIGEGLIPDGLVDARSIQEVKSSDLRGFTQCHFFAGIGGWAHALDLAGWPEEQPVWTGSCPCQPFSIAGKGEAFRDTRHLWPVWLRLISECSPSIVFGEQVASASGVRWADAVAQDLEAEGYAIGTVILPASSIGAPHQRDRFYFAAHAIGADPGGRLEDRWRLQVESEATRAQSYADWNGGRCSYDGVRMVRDGRVKPFYGRVRFQGHDIHTKYYTTADQAALARELLAATLNIMAEVSE